MGQIAAGGDPAGATGTAIAQGLLVGKRCARPQLAPTGAIPEPAPVSLLLGQAAQYHRPGRRVAVLPGDQRNTVSGDSSVGLGPEAPGRVGNLQPAEFDCGAIDRGTEVQYPVLIRQQLGKGSRSPAGGPSRPGRPARDSDHRTVPAEEGAQASQPLDPLPPQPEPELEHVDGHG